MESTITYVALVVAGVAYLAAAGMLWLAVRGRRMRLVAAVKGPRRVVEGPRRALRLADGSPRYAPRGRVRVGARYRADLTLEELLAGSRAMREAIDATRKV